MRAASVGPKDATVIQRGNTMLPEAIENVLGNLVWKTPRPDGPRIEGSIPSHEMPNAPTKNIASGCRRRLNMVAGSIHAIAIYTFDGFGHEMHRARFHAGLAQVHKAPEVRPLCR